PLKIGIIGVGYAGFDSMTPGLSTRELMFEAASRAYADAGINPRKDVQSFVCCTEDFWEGISITDEYMPDQLGAVLRPLCTVSSDGLVGVATACMHIASGLADVAVVESHSKMSDVVTPSEIVSMGFDPTYLRHLNVDPNFVAGLEMSRFLKETRTKKESTARVAVKNRRNALSNPRGVYGTDLTVKDVLAGRGQNGSESTTIPDLEISKPSDAGIVLVLASRKMTRKFGKDRTIWIDGIGWSSDTPWVEDRDLSRATYTEQSARRAYKMAAIRNPERQFDFAEADDTYAFKELQHLEALGIAPRGRAGRMLETGSFDRDGRLPVNASGGSLGVGHLIEATGLHKILETVLQLRGEAGP
ncbi:MAG TPA: hypothetical protein VE177_00800, partial [Candidatus Binatus sp.]|nr:hypothetical protein [Candidatus Binatus sp.]